MNNHSLSIAYHKWATLKVVGHIRTLPKEIHKQEIKSVFPSLFDTLLHMLEVDELWLTRIKNRAISVNENNTIEQLFANYVTLLNEYEQLGHDVLDRLVTYKSSEGIEYENICYEIIQHVVNHGTYHRGNISAMLRQLGNKTISTDYIYFLRERADIER
ncbi:DinB family protein [Metabacillus litoralis]|uniref:DinB family protein n=1 Tax=Metabacillus litoralis TaxID=152268 RepID=UPI00203F4894|nr:DinB family protein [Metabacillus litoralis]MCM3408812.1 damage-inducible protein DinB [Metabacillus litoralis]